ncbi:hypothetical protein M569_11805 [Genlisea aurea]|uniref:Uncharacterized protein n=1 Tax=Genlisea aurea TaxID=192259 RepID=S8C821_9LAMI|nr:hypothetical protein M569_11805 [Genlisea aurea]
MELLFENGPCISHWRIKTRRFVLDDSSGVIIVEEGDMDEVEDLDGMDADERFPFELEIGV